MRRVRTWCSALFVLAAALAAYGWAETRDRGANITIGAGRGSCHALMWEGCVQLTWSELPSGLNWGRTPSIKSGSKGSPSNGLDKSANFWHRQGFWSGKYEFTAGSIYRSGDGRVIVLNGVTSVRWVLFPVWLLVVALTPPVALEGLAWRRRRKRVSRGLCPSCGYDLRHA